ncbi:MAG: co-chaperone GroES [Candidatus Paceibacterota bacterium]
MAKKKNPVGIKPLADRVLIREETADEGEKKTESGIIIPDTVGDDNARGANRGEVVAVGDGKVDDDGKKLEIPVKAGDIVIFSWGEQLTIDEIDYHLVDQSNILAVVEG